MSGFFPPLSAQAGLSAFAKWTARDDSLTGMTRKNFALELLLKANLELITRLWISFLRSWKCLSECYLKIYPGREENKSWAVPVSWNQVNSSGVRCFPTRLLRCYHGNRFWAAFFFFHSQRHLYENKTFFLGVLLLLFIGIILPYFQTQMHPCSDQ